MIINILLCVLSLIKESSEAAKEAFVHFAKSKFGQEGRLKVVFGNVQYAEYPHSFLCILSFGV